MQHPWGCSAPPRGLPRSKAGGKRGPDTELLGRICPSSLHPSASLPAILQPALPASLGLGAGIAQHLRLQSPLLRGRAAPTARPKVCRPQAFLTASPSHPLWLPRLLFTGAALLAPGPGACAWVETASRWSYFFTFLGGRGGRFGKKPLGPGKQWEGADLQGGWLAWPRFCGVLPGTGGLGGETEARSIPPRAVSWLMVKSLTLAPSLRGCSRGDGVVQITLPLVGSSCPDREFGATGRARTWLLTHLVTPSEFSLQSWRGRKSPSAPSILNCIHRKLSKPHHCVRG